MLELIRKHRVLFSILFVLSAAGMIITMFGPSKYGNGGSSLSSMAGDVAARVEGEEISLRELLYEFNRQYEQAQRMMSAQTQGKDNSPESRKFMEQLIKAQVTPERILRQMVNDRFLVTTADSLGIVSSKNSLVGMIQSNPAFQTEGRFDPLVYKSRVAEPGVYEKALSQQDKYMKLSGTFESGLGVRSEQEAKLDEKLHTKYVFEVLSVNPKTFADPKSLSEAELKAWKDKPESAAKWKAYFERNLSKFQSDEQVKAAHLLVTDKEGGEKKALEILTEIKSGKITFAEAAKKYSTDKSNSDRGGDLGFFGRGVMDPAFEKAAFALQKAGDLTDKPVKSSFGWHLIQLGEKKAASKKTFEDVKDSIAMEAALEDKRAENAQALFLSWASSGKIPSDLKKYSLSWAKQPEWTAMDHSLGNIGSVEDHIGGLLAVNKTKPVYSKVISSGNSIAIARLVETKTSTTPSKSEDKVQEAMQFYLRNRMDGLEKSHKIRLSEKVLQTLAQQLETR